MLVSMQHRIEKVGKETISIADDVLSGHFHFQKSGILRQIMWESSDYASGAVFVITIANADGTVIYTSGNLAHNSSAVIVDLGVYISDESHSCTATTGDPGVGGATIGITLLVER